jgi:hypothetical protein
MIGELIGLGFVILFMLVSLTAVGFIIADSNYDKKRKDDWFRSVQGFQEVDLILSFIGCFMWTLVGLMWNDRALIVLNAVATFVLLTGIIKLFI